PSDLARGFQPTGQRYALAARVRGDVATAFPDGAPKKVAESNEGDNAADADAAKPEADNAGEPADREYLKASVKPINVVIVADTDVLSDRLWVQVHQFFGQQIMQPFADNGDFLF